MTAIDKLALKSAKVTSKIPSYGVDIALETKQGTKVLFIPCADRTHARFLRSQVNETKTLDGMPVKYAEIAQR